jgi:chemotaxis protein methyltransferase CheR
MISPDDYKFLSDLLRAQSGLSLGPGKDYLIESRLPAVAEAHGVSGLPSLLRALRLAGGTRPEGGRPQGDPGNRREASSGLVKDVCDAMTTGETLFFRDNTPFNVFKETLFPEAVARATEARRPVRIWSAACSTGQEVYSLAMLTDELGPKLGNPRVEFLATDYSTPTVAKAKQGLYRQLEVQRGLPIQMLLKHFTKVDDCFQVKDTLRNRVQFKEHNLLGPCSAFGQFDIIFVRNVLIYFDVPTKRAVLERLSKALAPSGAMVLGGTENTLGVTDTIVRRAGCPAAVYQRAEDVAAAAAAGRSAA